jgi:hypothetical protein
MNINLSIERLILDGIDLPRRQHPLLQAAVKGELERLVAEGGLPSVGLHVHSVQAGKVQFGDAHDPVTLGTAIAQSVYGGIVK